MGLQVILENAYRYITDDN